MVDYESGQELTRIRMGRLGDAHLTWLLHVEQYEVVVPGVWVYRPMSEKALDERLPEVYMRRVLAMLPNIDRWGSQGHVQLAYAH